MAAIATHPLLASDKGPPSSLLAGSRVGGKRSLLVKNLSVDSGKTNTMGKKLIRIS